MLLKRITSIHSPPFDTGRNQFIPVAPRSDMNVATRCPQFASRVSSIIESSYMYDCSIIPPTHPLTLLPSTDFIIIHSV